MTTDKPIAVTLKVSVDEFQNLYTTSMNWSGIDWRAADGRFEPMPDYRKWDRAYWFDSAVNLLVAKAFLDAINVEYSQHIDNVDHFGFVLLTNFGGKL